MSNLRFRIGNRQTLSADTHVAYCKQEPSDQEKLTLYYCLLLKEYDQPVYSIASFSYLLNSSQSLDVNTGHSNAMNVATLTDEQCNPLVHQTISIKGFRTPGDADANQFDENGSLIVRNLSRMYLEEYVITFYDKETKKNIGGISGALSYVDDGDGIETTVSNLTFPISGAYGVLEKFLNGKIEWTYYNEHPNLLRKLELFTR